MWKTVDTFALDYVSQMRTAQNSDDWNEQNDLRREAKRIQREIGKIVQAVDTLHRYGVKF